MPHHILNGRYRIEQKIGEGGMAIVYRGVDVRLNRNVAIKVLHSHYANDTDFRLRFQHEAQAAAILSHPGVVNVYDVGQDGDSHYIIMEYADGENLKSLILREAPLPVAQAVAIAEAIAHGLEAAHQLNLIHRDIKPQNIIVTPDGRVRITDFGIAKSHLSTALTDTGVTFGTADYISPEQARGAKATPRSDMYALGVTLYEMLTGRLPFTGDSAVSVAMQHVSSAPPLPRQANPLVPYHLEALLLRTLAKDPAERPPSARTFALLLHQYRTAAEQSTFAAAAPFEGPARPETRAVGAAGATGSLNSRSVAPAPRTTPARTRQSGSQGCGTFLVGLLLLGGVLGMVLLASLGILSPLPGERTPMTGGPVAAVVTPSETMPTTTPTPARTPTPTVTPTPTATPTPTVTSTPVPLAAVPDLRTLSEEAARTLLEQLGLVAFAGEPRFDSVVPRGQVAAQDLVPGTQLRTGQTVIYYLSLGPSLVELPDLVNVAVAFAVRRVSELGLTAEVFDEPSNTISEGFIIRQEPNPGARLEPGAVVYLAVSIGDKVRFPDVIGESSDQASNLIRLSGLELEYVDFQRRDRLGSDFDRYRPYEVISALANGEPVRNGNYIPRDSRIVLGVRAPE